MDFDLWVLGIFQPNVILSQECNNSLCDCNLINLLQLQKTIQKLSYSITESHITSTHNIMKFCILLFITNTGSDSVKIIHTVLYRLSGQKTKNH